MRKPSYRKGKTYEELYGIKKAKKYKLKIGFGNKGKQVSEETKKKISISTKKRFSVKENCPWWGKHHSIGTKRKMSLSHKKNPTKPMLGKKHTTETRKKMSGAAHASWEGHNRKFRNCIGKNNPHWGKPLSNWHKQKISESNKGKLSREKNPNWHGGSSFEPYSINFNKELKGLIRKRDNYSCQLCGTEQNGGRALTVHHIDYNKKNFDPAKLISLCITCHMKTNHHREYWQDYFEELIKTTERKK
jgi:hypothetical protein